MGIMAQRGSVSWLRLLKALMCFMAGRFLHYAHGSAPLHHALQSKTGVNMCLAENQPRFRPEAVERSGAAGVEKPASSAHSAIPNSG
jgi:hypothetical protein